MNKQIFEQDNLDNGKEENIFITKQEFDDNTIEVEEDIIDNDSLQGELLTESFTEIVKPKPRWWKKILGVTAVLFIAATIAQSIQWIFDSWQQNQWISLAFAVVSFSALFVGLSAIVKEMRHLIVLRQRMELQQKSGQILLKSAVDFKQEAEGDFEQGKQLCLDVADTMNISSNSLELIEWKGLVNEGHSSQEVVHLFNKTVLYPVDQQAKKLITRNSVECAVIIAVSPLAVVDMFFLAWRNIRLVNQLAKIYGIELGYISRIRLLKMVFINMAFAGATEVVQDMGMDWLSQDISAKLSSRIAQGIGVGLLTARLGIKAMEFCRPITFEKNERPRLSHIQKELLTTLKSTVLGNNKLKEHVKM